MDLRLLKTFQAAATSGSFTRAAETLGYAQSSVTAQMQVLEAELGAPLFDRLGRGIALTAAGRRFAPYADRLLALAEEARGVTAEDGNPTGTITIGAPETLCTYRLPPLLARFHGQFPHVRLVFRPSSGDDIRRGLGDGSLDVAFTLAPPMTLPGMIVEPLMSEPVHVLVAPEHRLTSAERVEPYDLAGEPLLLTEAGCAYRRLFLRTLEESGAQPNLTIEFSSVEAIKQCAMAGMGIAVLPAVAVATEVNAGRLVPLQWLASDLRVTTQVLRHREKWLSPAIEAFLDAARATLGASRA